MDFRMREKIWPLARAISPDLMAAVLCDASRYPGLEVTSRLCRSYAARASGARPGEIIAPLVGLADMPPEPPGKGEPPAALGGLSGIEAYYDGRLRGRAGWREYVADALVAESPPMPAPPLRLALDLDLQEAAWCALVRAVSRYREKKGSIVVMDLSTGGILACASYPSFDPNAYLARNREEFRRLEALRSDSPLANHALLAYRPGSVFKLFIAAAALERGSITPATTNLCGGLQDPGNRCNNHGDAVSLDLAGAIERSCNEYFIHAGSILARDGILGALPRFGFYRPEGTGIDLPERSRPVASVRKLVPTFFSFGEGMALATPIEIIRIVAAIALDGRAPVPRVALEGEPRSETFPISPPNARTLREAMRRVIFGAHGTARDTNEAKIGLEAFSVGAKTGTAEIRHADGPPTNNAWIAGFAPLEAPRFAFVVCLEDVDDRIHGGEAAGPVAAEILRALAAAGGNPDLKRAEVSQ